MGKEEVKGELTTPASEATAPHPQGTAGLKAQLPSGLLSRSQPMTGALSLPPKMDPHLPVLGLLNGKENRWRQKHNRNVGDVSENGLSSHRRELLDHGH